MTVVIAPGPASIGMPRGTMPMASRSRASWRSWAVSCVRDRSPCIIEKAIEKSRIPPAIRKAGIEVPKNRKMLFPTNAKMSRVTVAASTAFSITRCLTTAGPERLHRAVHLLPVGGVRPEVATGPQGIRCSPYGFPGIGDIEDDSIGIALCDPGPRVPDFEFDRVPKTGRDHVPPSLFQKVFPEIVGDHAALRADRVGESERHSTRARPNLHDEIAGFHIAVPQENGRILGTDDLSLAL